MQEASRNSEVDVRCMVDVRYWEKSSTISILERVCAHDARWKCRFCACVSKRRLNLQKSEKSGKYVFVGNGNGKYVFVGCMFRSYI